MRLSSLTSLVTSFPQKIFLFYLNRINIIPIAFNGALLRITGLRPVVLCTRSEMEHQDVPLPCSFEDNGMSRYKQSNNNYTDTFICRNCGLTVPPPELGRGMESTGTGSHHRNHCPHCLWSLHVDLKKGDRRCGCRGLMEPISVWVKPSKEWSIIHRCKNCGFIRTNRIAGDDNEMILFKLAAEPIMHSQAIEGSGQACLGIVERALGSKGL